MKTNSPDPNGLIGANPYKEVGGGGAGEAAGGCGTYGTESETTAGSAALDLINRTTGKGIVDTGNPPYRGGNYTSK